MDNKIVHAAPVPPFVTFVASAVPMVFDNSMSYYEALCALWKWLQDDVINVINNNATVTEHYIEITDELKEFVENYFDNLDVQEEINNKLDAMVADGTLQTLINNFIQPNVVWTFNTVSDMQSFDNLVDGCFAQTLGFRTVGDGGGAIYQIKDTGTDDGMGVIAVADDLHAHIVAVQKIVTPEMFGAYGDGTHDDTAAIKYAVSKCTTGSILKFRPLTYSVAVSGDNQSIIEIGEDNFVIEGNFAKIHLQDNTYQHYNLIEITDSKDFAIRDIELIGDRLGHTYTGGTHEWGYGIYANTDFNTLQSTVNCSGQIINCKIHDMTGDGIVSKNGYATGKIEILNCEIYKCRRQGISVLDSDTVIIRDTDIHEIGLTEGGVSGTAPSAGIDIEPASGTLNVNYVLIDGCNIEKTNRFGLVNGSDNVGLIEVKNTKISRVIALHSKTIFDNVTNDYVESADFFASNTDLASTDETRTFKYSYITLRGTTKHIFDGEYLHVKGIVLNSTWGVNNVPKLPPSSKIYKSIFENLLITTGDANTDIDPSVLNGNTFISCQFHNSGKALVFTDCTFIDCSKFSFNTSTQRTFIGCYFTSVPDANMKYKNCFLLDGTPIADNL